MKDQAEIIITRRLKLKPILMQEWRLYHKLYGSPKVMALFDSGRVNTEEETKNFVESSVNRWGNGDILSPFTIWNEKNQFIGFVNLRHEPCKQRGHIEIGYMIVEEHWNKGYAFEAAQGVMDYLKKLSEKGYKIGNINLTTVVATAHPDNPASQRILEKLDMHAIGEANRQGYPRVFFLKTFAAPINKSNYKPEDIFTNTSPSPSKKLRAKL